MCIAVQTQYCCIICIQPKNYLVYYVLKALPSVFFLINLMRERHYPPKDSNARRKGPLISVAQFRGFSRFPANGERSFS